MIRIIGLAAAVVMAFLSTAATAQPSARQIELSKRYIAAIHMDKTMDSTISAMLPMMTAQIAKSPNLTADQRKIVIEATSEAARDMVAQMVERMQPVIADTFTEGELSDLVAFYESASGQSMIAKTPLLASRMGPLMSELGPRMQAEVRARICAKISCAATPAKPA